MNRKFIAAFDLATATGVCDGLVGAPQPRCFSWLLRDAGDSRPKRLLMLAQYLDRYFEKIPVDGVVYEAPMPIGFLTNKKSTKIMMSEANVAFARGAVGVLEMSCEKHGKPVEALSVQDARQSVLGWRTNRTAEKTKARVMREVTTMHRIDAQTDDEADAAVLWMFACARLDPRVALSNTPLFASAT